VAGFNEGRSRPGGTGSLGTSGSLQFKQGGGFSGDNEITWDPTGDYLSVTGTISASYFYGDGSNLTGIGGSPGGSDTQVQFNDGGSFGGDSGLTFNKITNALTVGALTSSGGLNGGGDVASSNANLVISVLDTGAAPEGSYSGSIDLVMGDAGQGDAVHFKTFGSASVANINYQGNLNLDGNINMAGEFLTMTHANGAIECASVSQLTSLYGKSGNSFTVVSNEGDDLILGTADATTGIKIRIAGEVEGGSILSSSAGGIDIDLYTGSLKNVTTLSASSNVSASAFYGDGSTLSGVGETRVAYASTTTITDATTIAGVTSGSITLTLPSVSTFDGTKLIIKDESGTVSGSNTVIVSCSSGVTIDGETTATISSPYGSISTYHNGTNWFIY